MNKYYNEKMITISEKEGDPLEAIVFVTDQNGNVKARHDYLPFGEELGSETGSRVLASGYSQPDGLRQKFTQKERDIETGLDYFIARYYASTQGRFTSVDPENAGAEPGNPQSWNGYAYTINNPLLYSDPDGREFTICFAQGRNCDTVSDAEFNRIRNDGTALGAVFKDNAIYNDVSGTGELVLTATFGRTSFDDLSAQANAVIFGNRNTAGLAQRLPAVETAAEIGFNIAFGIISGGTTLAGSGLTTLGIAEATAATATIHGAARLAARNFTQADIIFTKTGTQLLQRDGARVFLKEVAYGKYNVIVENSRGVVTALKNLSWKSVSNLAKNYGWYSPR